MLKFRVSLLLFILLAMLVGCSGGPTGGAPAPQATAAPAPTAVTTTLRKLIKNAALTLRVPQITPASERIRAKATELGGFVSNSRFDVNSDHNETASVEAKVPAEKLDLFLQEIEPLGKVLSKSETGEDVTEQFIDSEARRSNLQREEERLLVILKSAGGLKDLLAVEQELTRVRGELEKTEGHLKHLNYQVDYSTVSVTLTATGQGESVSFWDLSGTVANSWLMLRLCLRLLLQATIYFVFFLPLFVPLWWIHRRASRKSTPEP